LRIFHRKHHQQSHTTQKFPGSPKLHSLSRPSHDRSPQWFARLSGSGQPATGRTIRQMSQGSFDVRLTASRSDSNARTSSSGNEAKGRRAHPARTGCLTLAPSKMVPTQFPSIPQSSESMQIHFTSHIHSALLLEWRLHQAGRQYRPSHRQTLGELASSFQHPSPGAVALRPIPPVIYRRNVMLLRQCARCVVASTDPQHSRQPLPLGSCQRCKANNATRNQPLDLPQSLARAGTCS